MTLPGTTQAMVEELVVQYQQSIANIAKQVGVSTITIQRILAGSKPSRQTHIRLLSFYCCVRS